MIFKASGGWGVGGGGRGVVSSTTKVKCGEGHLSTNNRYTAVYDPL